MCKRLPEDELSGSKHVEYIEKIIFLRRCIFSFILYHYITIHGAQNI